MYMYIHRCVYMYSYWATRSSATPGMDVYMYVCIYIYTYIYIYMYIHIYI